jgi:hypothetical protein
MVDAQIVGDSQHPGQELTFFVVTTGTHGIDHFYKSILEDVFGNIPVFDQQINGGINPAFVPEH